jgi:hypothetical protein
MQKDKMDFSKKEKQKVKLKKVQTNSNLLLFN